MDLLWAALVISMIGAARAVPCSDIAMDTWKKLDTGAYQLEHISKYTDPLATNGEWDVIPLKDQRIYMRFQVPRNGQTRKDARVTTTKFDTTPQQVIWKMNNYHSTDDGIQLWLPGDSYGFAYGNVANLAGTAMVPIDGQSNLDASFSVLSIRHMTVLPSGVKKLQTVSTSGMKDCDFQERTNVARAEQVGITGLTGEMDKSDYAYTSGMEVRIAMNRLRHEQREVGWPESDSVTGWFSAEKADGNCVVFDLTGAFLFTK